MRVLMLVGCFSGFCFMTLVCASTELRAAQVEETLFEAINRLPETERQARLVNGAKKEGAVTWYVAMNRAYAQDLINVFEADYPFLKVNALTTSGASLLNRVLTEYRARSYLYDVFNTRSTTIGTLKKAAAIIRYRSPYRLFLRDGFYDKDGFFNGIFATPLVFIFNTKLVGAKEAPRSLDDLLNPKWTGKLAMDAESYDWLAALMDYYGEEKGAELARKIGDQKLNVRRGPTLLTQLVAAGEFSVEIDGYHQEAIAQKRRGAPTDYNFPEPFVPAKSLVPIYMASHPPHPYAAALLADFLMSKKGQAIMYGHGRWVGHKEIKATGPDDIGNRKVVIPSPEKWGDRYQELIALYNKILMRQ
ncbi:MAG TPA: extracellular solute-binding protein [Candidatus Acidoferrales bacterium]|nr:extracellular solute-binding protein [Candidatus Acidoferrales bacterium]